ncbi:MAG TPA: AMP-binding protein [Clostridiaceae bacterium]|nr:AMP-binding protein [Clostridiaceae bacterium]
MEKTTYLEGKALHPKKRYNDLRELLQDRVQQTPTRPAYRYRIGAERRTMSKTYEEFWQDIHAVGAAFIDRKLIDPSRVPEGKHMRQADALGIIGNNSYSWILMYTAYLFGLGVAVPIDNNLKVDEAAGLANRAELKVLAYTKSHRKIAEGMAEQCPTIHTLIALEPTDEEGTLLFDGHTVDVLPIHDLINQGEHCLKTGSTTYGDRPIEKNDVAAIFFTSGTTANSKGVMLSHWNIASCVYCGHTIIDSWGRDSALSILPLHHTYENAIGQIALWQMGTTIYFNDHLRHVQNNLIEWNIEILYMVPLILEMLHRKLLKAIEKQGKMTLFKAILKISNGLRKIGIDLRRPLFKNVRRGIGPNLKSFMVGGAPLKSNLLQFFWDIGFDVWNAYGLTECAPGLAIGNEKTITADSVGIPIAEAKMRITTDSINNQGESVGELQVISDNVMLGYFRDPSGTAKAFTDDGWFKTEDYGYFKGNNLHLTGRANSIIVLENGKNVFPEELETLLREIPNVSDAMLWAEPNRRGQTELYARLELDHKAIGAMSKSKVKRISEELEAALKSINEKLPHYKTIRSFLWSIEPMIRTTTQKIKRREEIKRIHAFLKSINKTMREVSGMCFLDPVGAESI